MNVPAGTAENGWPVGVQISGQWGSDRLLIKCAETMAELDM